MVCSHGEAVFSLWQAPASGDQQICCISLILLTIDLLCDKELCAKDLDISRFASELSPKFDTKHFGAVIKFDEIF